MSIGEKLVQIDATLKHAINTDPTIRAMYPIVVTAGPLRMNPMLIDIANSDPKLAQPESSGSMPAASPG